MYQLKCGLYLFLYKQLFVLVASVIKKKEIITLSRLLCVSLLIANTVLRKHLLKHKKNFYWIMKQPPSCWSIPINNACHISGLYRSNIVTVFSRIRYLKVSSEKWIMSAMNWELPQLTYYVFSKKMYFQYISIPTSYTVLNDNENR